MGKRIGFVSTRFAGTDGVSLESAKWAQILLENQNTCYWFAGELDRPPELSMLVPEAFFEDATNRWINDKVFGSKHRSFDITEQIHSLRSHLKRQLYEFIDRFKIDILVPQNALSIPMHIPLGLAITELAAETEIPTIAHHHDFPWERSRFTVNSVQDFLHMAFPPKLANIQHVVINTIAQEELALRTGIAPIVIPNVLHFEYPPVVNDPYAADFRRQIGLQDDDVVILHPTRIVQRKGIEHAIELVAELDDPRYKLIITHNAGDEGFEYADWLKQIANERNVDLRLIADRITKARGVNARGEKCYTLWDVYPHADFVTYTSLYEGFGNAFLEAIYFRKPILINRYDVFIKDIEPQGFDLIVMNGFITDKIVQQVGAVLESSQRRREMVEHNYRVAGRHYSYTVLRDRLRFLIANFFGIRI